MLGVAWNSVRQPAIPPSAALIFVLPACATFMAGGCSPSVDDLLQQETRESDPHQRIRILDRALELKPDPEWLKEIRLRRGWAWRDLGRYPEAADEFGRAIETDENFHQARDSLAWTLYYNLGERDRAKKEFSALIAASNVPKELVASAYNGLAEIHRSERDFDRALVLHEKGVAVSPTPVGLHNLAWLYNTHRKDFAKAVELCEKAIELEPSYDYGRVSLAVFLANKGDKERAAAILARVGRFEPVMYGNLACYYAVLGNADEALRYVKADLKEYHVVAKKRNQERDYCLKDWHFDSVRGDPRFQDLMKKDPEQ
jgi:tetratricopeptide (TPR) repeat protein